VAYTTYTAGHGTQVWPANQFASNTQSGSGYIRANVERLSNGAVLLRGSEGEQELLDSRKIEVVDSLTFTDDLRVCCPKAW